MSHILVLEDDSRIADGILLHLKLQSFQATHVATVKAALGAISKHRYDLAIVDLGLPDGSGIEVCERLREVSPELPFLVLTAQTDEKMAVKSFTLGAADFVRKPCGMDELLSRVRRLLRLAPQEGHLRLGALSFATETKVASFEGKSLTLTPTEFELFHLIAKRYGGVLTRAEALQSMDPEGNTFDRTLDTHISNIRNKLKRIAGQKVVILTRHGVGYSLEIP